MKNCKKYVSVLLCLSLALGLVTLLSCGETGGAGVTQEVTLPDMTDDREPSDEVLDAYAEKISSAFEGIDPVAEDDLTYTVADGGVTLTGYTGGEVVVVLPDTIEDMPVVAIAEKAFSGSPMEALYIPNSICVVGFGALEKCNSLRTLRTPVVMAGVGDLTPYFGALFGASTYEVNNSAVPRTLTTLILGEGVEVIPDYAFYDCTSLMCVSLPKSLVSIGKFAFWGCMDLEYMDLSVTALTSIGTRALTNCMSLLRFDLPSTVEAIGEGAIEGCGALEGLTLPFVGGSADGVPAFVEAETDADGEEISPARCDYLGYIFGATSYTFTVGFIPASLREITLHDGCTSIPDNAFYGVSCVSVWGIPDSVTTIGRRAFYDCQWMTSFALPQNLTTIGDDAFHGCYRLESVTGGEVLTDMGVQVFMDCYSLKSVTLPDSLAYIPNACFAGCISLETVTANGVKSADSVGKQAYRHCDKLTEAPFGENIEKETH